MATKDPDTPTPTKKAADEDLDALNKRIAEEAAAATTADQRNPKD